MLNWNQHSTLNHAASIHVAVAGALCSDDIWATHAAAMAWTITIAHVYRLIC